MLITKVVFQTPTSPMASAQTSPAPSSATAVAEEEAADHPDSRGDSRASPRASESPAPSSADGQRSRRLASTAASESATGASPPARPTSKKKRVYKPYVYSEAQRARKAAYKREMRRREKEQRFAFPAGLHARVKTFRSQRVSLTFFFPDHPRIVLVPRTSAQANTPTEVVPREVNESPPLANLT